nr:helix-turn-helix domain-containing protein [Massilia sp. JS1662]
MKAWMHHPQGELAEALHGIGFYSTVDEPWPPAQPQLNRFPAMVYCSLNFFTEGAAALTGDDGELRAMSDLIVSGPRTRPIASLTLAPLRTVGIVLYPDAFALLTGLSPAALQDRNDPADGLLDDTWADWPQALRACADEAAQAAWIEARLGERWRAVRGRWDAELGASLRSIASTAPELGVGDRQTQRQYRARVGLSPAQARRLQRMNAAVYALRDPNAPARSLADLAAELGYADQAHMARELRELAFLPPSRLEAHIDTDPEYWPYRL